MGLEFYYSYSKLGSLLKIFYIHLFVIHGFDNAVHLFVFVCNLFCNVYFNCYRHKIKKNCLHGKVQFIYCKRLDLISFRYSTHSGKVNDLQRLWKRCSLGSMTCPWPKCTWVSRGRCVKHGLNAPLASDDHLPKLNVGDGYCIEGCTNVSDVQHVCNLKLNLPV